MKSRGILCRAHTKTASRQSARTKTKNLDQCLVEVGHGMTGLTIMVVAATPDDERDFGVEGGVHAKAIYIRIRAWRNGF